MMYDVSGSTMMVHIILKTIVGTAFWLGAFFLLVWCVKTMKPAQLKRWGLWLLITSIVVCTAFFFLGFSHGGMNFKMMKGGMMNMMDDDDMMEMSMNDMSTMLEGKTGDDFDKAFLSSMIVHHEGAIDMAAKATNSAGHKEIKTMAEKIINAQQQEIDQMKRWQSSWSY